MAKAASRKSRRRKNDQPYKPQNARTAEREALTRQLQEREARLEEAQAIANVGSWNWDADTAKLRWSDEFYRLTGVAMQSDVTLETAMDLVHPNDRERIKATIQQALRDRKPFALEFRLMHDDGAARTLLVHGHVEARRDGAILRVFGTAQDVTSLKQAEDSLRDLSARLLRLQDEERRHMARDLHDSTSQILAALSMNLAVLADARDALDPVKRAALEEAQTLAETCSREIRTMSYLLHPPMLEEGGLLPALEWYVQGFQKRSGVTVKLHVPARFERLHPEVEITLFRLVQEALTNVHRHSGSPTAEVDLRQANGNLHLEIRDHGRGFDDEAVRKVPSVLGVGIIGMQERVRQLGGSLKLIDAPNGGTIVRARVNALPAEPGKASAEHAS